jgi:ACR3 family arsenite efflux pump ArsB
MWRAAGSIVVGLVTWTLVATIMNFGLRAALPDYHAAEATLQFTMAMKVGRLTLAALASLAAGASVRAVAPTSRWAPWIAGAIVLALFVPVHVQLWSKFPIWYHLTFLLSLVPLFGLGAALMPHNRSEPRAATS